MPNKTPHQRYHRVSQLFDPPAYVKEAADADILDDGSRDPGAFADPERRYPIHTKAATWYSAATFADESSPPSSAGAAVRRNIVEAAAGFGIGRDVEAVFAKAAGREDLSGLPDSAFAVLDRDGRGRVASRSLPIRDAREVKAAAESLVAWGHAATFEVRRAAAARVLEKAAAEGVDLGAEVESSLQATAGLGRGRRDEVAAALSKRAALLAKAPHGLPGLVGDWARDFLSPRPGEHPTFVEPADAMKVAGIVDRLDHSLGLSRDYAANGLRPIEHALFGITKRAVEEFARGHVEVAGSYYEREKLAAIELPAIAAALGDAFAAAATEDGLFVDAGKLAAALSRPGPDGDIDRGLFAKVAAAAGVAPVARTKVAAAGISLADLRAIASTLPDGTRGPRNLDAL